MYAFYWAFKAVCAICNILIINGIYFEENSKCSYF
jgi:hypothetical protein